VLPSPSLYGSTQGPATTRGHTNSGVDVDLDLGPATASPPLGASRSFAPSKAPEMPAASDLPSFELPSEPVAPAASRSNAMEFDLSDISLDLNDGASLPDISGPDSTQTHQRDSGEAADPLMRKLELAEEFRQIGDMEGARDLVQEVIAKADGALKARAQSMLADLA
jgi:pilus assembly protein FimV